MYKFTLSKPIDGIESIEFPRLTWAAYKKLMMSVQSAKALDEKLTTVQALTTAFIELGKPVLTDEQIDKLTISDVDEMGELYTHMEKRKDEWSGGQFKLSTPIPVSIKDGEANLTGLTFKSQTISGAWDYLGEPDAMRQYELFIKKFGRHVGDHSDVKELPFNSIWIDIMDAKDVLFIGKQIAGKPQGESPSWELL